MASREDSGTFYFIVDMRNTIRDVSPEGGWTLNAPPGTTTDDTRWKKLIVKYLTSEVSDGPTSLHRISLAL